ncbi:hypothetical protein LINPERHAP2_LOCUS6523, partial [Linum perenne]
YLPLPFYPSQLHQSNSSPINSPISDQTKAFSAFRHYQLLLISFPLILRCPIQHPLRDLQFTEGSSEIELRLALTGEEIPNPKDVFVDADGTSLRVGILRDGFIVTLMEPNQLFDRVGLSLLKLYGMYTLDTKELLETLAKQTIDSCKSYFRVAGDIEEEELFRRLRFEELEVVQGPDLPEKQ